MAAPRQPEIYLASRSPRRRQLLEQIGLPFTPLDVDVDERWNEEDSPEVFAIRLALEKARAGWAQAPADAALPTLGADTTVVFDDRVLGKPRDDDEARAMLHALSDREHQVLTGIALVDGHGEATRLSANRVRFRALDETDVERYIASGEPVGKAGGYAIQGIGGVFVSHLEGSYSGVMGLPLYETTDLLAEYGVDFRRHWND